VNDATHIFANAVVDGLVHPIFLPERAVNFPFVADDESFLRDVGPDDWEQLPRSGALHMEAAYFTCPSRKSYPRVAMMQSGQDWCGDDGPRSLDVSSYRGVLAQPQARTRLIVIERIQSQDPSQMPFAIDQDVIEALAP
jgi:hypothetical protein